MSVYQRQHLHLHPLFITLCQYIREKRILLTHFWLHCVSVSDPKFLLSSSFAFIVSVKGAEQFYPHQLFVTLCKYIRDNSFILKHFSLQSVCILETTVISTHTFAYTVSVYQRKYFYLHNNLVALCQCIIHNNCILTTLDYTV